MQMTDEGAISSPATVKPRTKSSRFGKLFQSGKSSGEGDSNKRSSPKQVSRLHNKDGNSSTSSFLQRAREFEAKASSPHHVGTAAAATVTASGEEDATAVEAGASAATSEATDMPLSGQASAGTEAAPNYTNGSSSGGGGGGGGGSGGLAPPTNDVEIDAQVQQALEVWHATKKLAPEEKKLLALTQKQLAHALTQSTRLAMAEGTVQLKHDKYADGSHHKTRKWRSTMAKLRGFILTLHEKDGSLSEAPMYILPGGVTEEPHPKRGTVLRVRTRQGEVLMQPDKSSVQNWKVSLSHPWPTLMDCCHYISTEGRDALEGFVTRSTAGTTTPEAIRLKVALLGLSDCGKTTTLQGLTTQGARETSTQPTVGSHKLDVYWSHAVTFQVWRDPQLPFSLIWNINPRKFSSIAEATSRFIPFPPPSLPPPPTKPDIQIHDVSGRDTRAWHDVYSPAPFALAYMVDCCDRESLPAAAVHLQELLGGYCMGGAPAAAEIHNRTPVSACKHFDIFIRQLLLVGRAAKYPGPPPSHFPVTAHASLINQPAGRPAAFCDDVACRLPTQP